MKDAEQEVADFDSAKLSLFELQVCNPIAGIDTLYYTRSGRAKSAPTNTRARLKLSTGTSRESDR